MEKFIKFNYKINFIIIYIIHKILVLLKTLPKR